LPPFLPPCSEWDIYIGCLPVYILSNSPCLSFIGHKVWLGMNNCIMWYVNLKSSCFRKFCGHFLPVLVVENCNNRYCVKHVWSYFHALIWDFTEHQVEFCMTYHIYTIHTSSIRQYIVHRIIRCFLFLSIVIAVCYQAVSVLILNGMLIETSTRTLHMKSNVIYCTL